MSETLINYLNTPGADEADLESALIGRIPLVGARATMSANLTGQNYSSLTAVTFNSEDYDTDAFHNTSTNTERLTIPSGKAGFYVISMSVNVTSITADEWVLVDLIWNNSSDAAQFVWSQTTETGAGQRRFAITTDAVWMAEGDYVYFALQTESDTSVDVASARTSLSLRRVATVPTP